ncbi:endonuclease VII domain-containing protein [Streptomyces atratus]|uniref:endonuclease VII domain-containing protein n=1 Tax=Streptomyces atratus TaxID=1893 RepID=UPI0021A39AAD|nr:endonuclease VII domain-containing protein [Streptomyces atratus]MCT2546211.1 endonuclease VII domain-containing protein [Streptomyces atratus]
MIIPSPMATFTDAERQLRADGTAPNMTPALIERVLMAKRLVDRYRTNWCRGIRGYSCRNGTLEGVPACLRHLSPDELQAVELLLRWAQPLVDRWLSQLAPVCWFWPVPEAGRFMDAVTFMFDWQQSRCAICGRPGRRGGTRSDSLVLDHDHNSGIARGFLCHPCNKREGLDRPGDGRYANYRRRPPTALLDISVPYDQWRP